MAAGSRRTWDGPTPTEGPHPSTRMPAAAAETAATSKPTREETKVTILCFRHDDQQTASKKENKSIQRSPLVPKTCSPAPKGSLTSTLPCSGGRTCSLRWASAPASRLRRVGSIRGSIATALVNLVEAMLVRAHNASGRSSARSVKKGKWQQRRKMCGQKTRAIGYRIFCRFGGPAFYAERTRKPDGG